jgi:hypothetical protein
VVLVAGKHGAGIEKTVTFDEEVVYDGDEVVLSF